MLNNTIKDDRIITCVLNFVPDVFGGDVFVYQLILILHFTVRNNSLDPLERGLGECVCVRARACDIQ